MPYAPPTGFTTLVFGGAKIVKKFIKWLNSLLPYLAGITLTMKSPFLVNKVKKKMSK